MQHSELDHAAGATDERRRAAELLPAVHPRSRRDISDHGSCRSPLRSADMVSTWARNGDVDIYYEEFGDPEEPTLLLINGLGSQCVNYQVEWCQLFCDEGFHVVRFDNRDVGLSSKLEGSDYTLADMADDAVAVLDALGVEQSHVMGCSMGGMIVQRLSIDHPDRLLSMTSVMSRTGEPGYGESSEEALAFLLAPPAPSWCGLHRSPGGCPPRVRIEARVARRGRHPCPCRRRLRPLLLPRGESGGR